jgi:hypothetical protein
MSSIIADFLGHLFVRAAVESCRPSACEPQALPVASIARKERIGSIHFTVSRSAVAIAAPPNFPAWSELELEFGAFVQEIVALDAARGAEALADTLASDWQKRADARLNHRRIAVQVEAATRFIGSDFIVITFWRNTVPDEVPAQQRPPQSLDCAEPGAAAPFAATTSESMFCRQVPSAPPAPIAGF